MSTPVVPAPAPRSPARYFAWLYADARQRSVLQVLLALEEEIAAALRPGMDHGVAHARMQWWREECGRTAAGTALHPLTRELLARRPAGAGATDLSGLVNTAVWDLAAATFETRRELTGYCEQWARSLPQLAAGWAPPPGMNAVEAGRFGLRLGIVLRELELLDGLAADARAGRLRLPLSELTAAGIDPGALARPPWPDALRDLVSARHLALRAQLLACIDAVAPVDQDALRGLLVWAQHAYRQSLRSARPSGGGRPSQEGAAAARPDSPRGLHRFADAWSAWNGARRAAAGRFRLG